MGGDSDFYEDFVADWPDPELDPRPYHGTLMRRSLGYSMDVIAIALISLVLLFPAIVLGLVSFGLLFGPLMLVFAVIPLAYHTVLIGRPSSATLGMRFMGVEVRMMNGKRPDFLQAALMTIAFYVSVGLTTWLILIVALFNRHKRTLHDMLAGTLVVNRGE